MSGVEDAERWEAVESGSRCPTAWAVRAGTRFVADVEREADARFIAGAPSLLARAEAAEAERGRWEAKYREAASVARAMSENLRAAEAERDALRVVKAAHEANVKMHGQAKAYYALLVAAEAKVTALETLRNPARLLAGWQAPPCDSLEAGAAFMNMVQQARRALAALDRQEP